MPTLMLNSIPPREPLIADMMSLDSLVWVAGAPGSYKSFLAMDWALSVATGIPWHHRPVKHAPVVYVTGEGRSGLLQRVEAWKEGKPAADWAWWHPEAVHALSEEWWMLVQAVHDLGARMVVIDTQSNMTTGMDENSAQEMSRWVNRLQELQRATAACVVVVHHASKGGEQLRGSSVMQGAADSIYTLERATQEPLSHVTVRNTKQKDIPQVPEFMLRPVPTLGSIVLEQHA